METKISVLFIIIVCLSICSARDNRNWKRQIFYMIILCFYIINILNFTIIGRNLLESRTMHLTPLGSYYSIYINAWHYSSKYYVMEIIGNILLFLPMGIIVSIYTQGKNSYVYAMLISFGISFIVENLQLILNVGTFSVDDLIHNVWGSSIGCSTYLIIKESKQNIIDRKSVYKKLIPIFIFGVLIGLASTRPLIREIIKSLGV